MDVSSTVLNMQIYTAQNSSCSSDASEGAIDIADGDCYDSEETRKYNKNKEMEFFKNALREADGKIQEIEGKLVQLEIKMDMMDTVNKINNKIDQMVEMQSKPDAPTETKIDAQEESKDKLEKHNDKEEDKDNIATYLPFGKTIPVKLLYTPGIKPFIPIYQDNIAGSGWIVMLRRINGDVDFYNRSWSEFNVDIGKKSGDYCLGLEKLHRMTIDRQHELYIHLVDYNNETRYARYDNFVVDSTENKYKLKSLGEYTGNAGDAMRWHEEAKFGYEGTYESYWWHKPESDCNLMGKYSSAKINDKKSIWWGNWNDDEYLSLKSVEMLVRPKSNEI